jgi:hypothetical protein
LRIKTKNLQTIQCSYNNDSFDLILNDSFLNILNVKEKTDSWPQSFHDINAFLTKVFFLPIFSNSMLNNISILFAFFATIIMNIIDCVYVVQVGANRTFYFQGVPKATPTLDLVIADISEGLPVPGISTPSSSIPSWNAKSDKFFLVLFSFCMQYLHDDGVLLIFHPEDPRWTKELSTYFFQLQFQGWSWTLDLCEATSSSQSSQSKQNG